MEVRKANQDDINCIVEIYKECFPREVNHADWINACYNSAPKGVYYTVVVEGIVAGYILWCVKNGFREKTIVELEQIGVSPAYSGKGVGRFLIVESKKQFSSHIQSMGFTIGAILVTTSEGNYAENLYTSSLGLKRECVIKNYGSGNEVILYKSNI